jgi:Zn-dependent protease with chaperone function
MRLRILVRLLMLFYFPYLVGVIVGACAFFIYALMRTMRFDGPLVLLLAPAGLVIVLSMAHFALLLSYLLRPVPTDDPFEVELPSKRIAGLRQLAFAIAEERGLPPPDELRLHADTVACVYEDKRGQRILVVGCMAVAALSKEALSGIIAHELGHFAGGDTSLSRSGISVLRFVGRFEIAVTYLFYWYLNPIVLALRAYHLAFMVIRASQSREAEYAADRHEAELVGKEVAAATLILFEIISHLPWTRLSSVGRSYAMHVQRDEDIFAEVVRRAQATDPNELKDACRKALKAKTGWLDSHPCLKERLKAMGVSSKKASQLALDLFNEGEPASTLFPDWPAIQKEFSDELMLIFREAHEARREMIQIARRVF